jgi:hypothetical protein
MTLENTLKLFEQQVEVVPAADDPMGAKVYIDNKEVPWEEINNNYPGIKEAVKEVYKFINKNYGEHFRENQPQVKDITFKASGEVTLQPEKPIEIEGTEYKRLKYTLKNTKAINAIKKVANSGQQKGGASTQLKGKLAG